MTGLGSVVLWVCQYCGHKNKQGTEHCQMCDTKLRFKSWRYEVIHEYKTVDLTEYIPEDITGLWA